MKKAEKRSMRTFFRLVAIFPFAFFVLLVLGSGTFAALYVMLKNDLYLYILIGYALLMAVVYILVSIKLTKRFNMLFVRGLYSITAYNLSNITDNENALIDYPNHTYEEFVALNEQVETLKKELDNSTLITSTVDFSHINLDYLDVDRHIITLRSFEESLEEIIFASQNYRNVIVELFYELGEDILDGQDIAYLTTLLYKSFNDYQQFLIIVNDDRKSLLMYFPRIDSLSKIRESVSNILKSATINKRTPEGIANLIAHFALVCYPYSDVMELFPDLAYAKRQGEIINVYLPNRFVSI